LTTKECPHCGAGVSHYHGHACHHISDQGGCPHCREHWCYVCGGTEQFDASGAMAADGCPSHWTSWCTNADITDHLVADAEWPADDRCGCPICPDCRKEEPCPHCNGNCVVCEGVVPHGEHKGNVVAAVAATRHLQERLGRAKTARQNASLKDFKDSISECRPGQRESLREKPLAIDDALVGQRVEVYWPVDSK
jgi:hypothetical protein